ncbi:glutathione peroxidase [Arthrobacter sp. 35W]|uniref:glutathione peroxidase n=1 Tax=Arthrobacter sp. 35W TaxID=1132441 RepID=UPI00054F4513|nr:glutathione peroxidase [Arthrobacter sp. 35W]
MHSIPLALNDGTEADFGRFAGKTVLVVNVASACGFTRQYDGLQALYTRFQDRGFEILGVPCNQFGAQESGSDAEIEDFCRKNFGVTFALAAKTDVNGEDQHPLYAALIGSGDPIRWNFEKFLVGPDGAVIARYASDVEPESEDLLAAIEAALV